MTIFCDLMLAWKIMKKPKDKIEQEKLSKNGKVWVHVPEMNIRQGSGVEFRGKYMTRQEFRTWMQKIKLLKRRSK